MDAADDPVREIGMLLPQIAKNLRIPTLLDSVRRGLSSSQLLILLLLDQAADSIVRMSDIARELGVSLPTATGLVDRLLRDGLVDRRANPDDRRMVLAVITPDGRKLIRHVLRVLDNVLDAVLSNMNEADQQAVAAATQRIFELSLLIRDEEQRLAAAR